MMTSMQTYSPHPGGMQQQHPGMAPGHPMAMPHNQGQQGQPGPGMQMQMGVSGPGPQVTQGGAMMGGMPPGAGGPSQHALHHLNPGQAQQAQFLQQQQAMCKYFQFATFPVDPSSLGVFDGPTLTTPLSSRDQSSIADATTADDSTTTSTTSPATSYAGPTIQRCPDGTSKWDESNDTSPVPCDAGEPHGSSC